MAVGEFVAEVVVETVVRGVIEPVLEPVINAVVEKAEDKQRARKRLMLFGTLGALFAIATIVFTVLAIMIGGVGFIVGASLTGTAMLICLIRVAFDVRQLRYLVAKSR